ncbi:MAG: hypothetical protein PHX27_00245 [Candidatus ainarchaeum sp.]|nr:hypothetical protein [Candidatus ainarchaeum sp.]
MAKEFKEKIITINLRKVFEKPSTKRAKSALFALKKAVKKETRSENIKISNQVNEELWQNGLFKSLRRITVKLVTDKNIIRVLMPQEKFEAKEEKKEKKTIKEKLEEKKEQVPNLKEEKIVETKKEEKPIKQKDEKIETTKNKKEK